MPHITYTNLVYVGSKLCLILRSRVHDVQFYRFPKHNSCHGIFRRMQAFCAIKMIGETMQETRCIKNLHFYIKITN